MVELCHELLPFLNRHSFRDSSTWGLSLWDEYAEAWWPSVVQSTWWTGWVLNWEGRGEEGRVTTAIMTQLLPLVTWSLTKCRANVTVLRS